MIRKLLLISLVSVTFFAGCKKDEETAPVSTTTGGTVSNPARDAALADYNSNYLGSAVSITGWTGNAATCVAGLCSAATNEAVIRRINYFRKLAGLNYDCILDSTLFAQEQEAALMQSANNSLNHYPPNTWSCYTSSGYTGSSSSNLALGYHSTSAITAFIKDDGTGNEPVGHRRWILHTNKKYFSYGSTNNSMALYVLRSTTNPAPPSYVAYPPANYIPNTLVPSRWSFSIPNASFALATVTMTGPGNATIPVTVISRSDNGYGDNTIVWTATGINTSSSSDVAYTVTISGIGGAAQTSYTYTTTIFTP